MSRERHAPGFSLITDSPGKFALINVAVFVKELCKIEGKDITRKRKE